MDTSKEYIKMCDCPEIQEEWESKVGDFYFVRDGLFRPMSTVDVYDGGGYAVLPRDANYGWLPRQDQIQEMLGGYPILYCLRMLYMEFHPEFEPDSFEQLWLAFYMHDKHKKKWDDKRWK